MKLTRSMATAIVTLVEQDKTARERIDGWASFMPDGWGVAGSIRNFG